MDIGIIGSGKIGGTAAALFTRTEHRVVVGNSRGPASLASLVRELGPQARASTVQDACIFGEVVLVAIPYGKYQTLPAERLEGKIVVDAMNYYPQRDGQIELGDLTSTELLAQFLGGARVVKAFNTMFYQTLATRGQPGTPLEDRLALFVAGDDAKAKDVVSRLIEQIGFAPIDTGTHHHGGRLQQPGSPIYNRPMTAREAWTVLAGLR